MSLVRHLADGVMRRLGGLLVRIFFRTIEVDGAGRWIPGVPTIVLSNHLKGLVTLVWGLLEPAHGGASA